MIVAACKSLGFESQGVKLGTESGTEPSMMWFSMFEKNLAVNLKNFTIRVMVSLDPSSPCSIKLLFTELVEKLRQNLVQHIKKYIWQLWNLIVDFNMPLDEIIVLDHFNSLDTDGVEQRDGIPSPNIK